MLDHEDLFQQENSVWNLPSDRLIKMPERCNSRDDNIVCLLEHIYLPENRARPLGCLFPNKH